MTRDRINSKWINKLFFSSFFCFLFYFFLYTNWLTDWLLFCSYYFIIVCSCLLYVVSTELLNTDLCLCICLFSITFIPWMLCYYSLPLQQNKDNDIFPLFYILEVDVQYEWKKSSNWLRNKKKIWRKTRNHNRNVCHSSGNFVQQFSI